MPYTHEDRILIKHYRERYGWGSKRILKELETGKSWTQRGIEGIIVKVDANQSVARKPGSSRPRSARTQENIEQVELRILSQEEPHTHVTPSDVFLTNCFFFLMFTSLISAILNSIEHNFRRRNYISLKFYTHFI